MSQAKASPLAQRLLTPASPHLAVEPDVEGRDRLGSGRDRLGSWLSDLTVEDERFSSHPAVAMGFASRAFRPMTDGGIRPSVFTLVSTAVGGGVLTIPYMFRLCGVWCGLGLLVLGAFCANETMYILMIAAHKTQCSTYAALMAQCFGPSSAILLDLIISIYGVGAIISYLIFLGDFIPSCAVFLGIHITRSVAIWMTVAVGMPLAMPQSLKVFSYISPFATLALALTASVAIYKAFTDGMVPGHQHEGAIIDLNIFKCFGISTFAYMCHLNVVPVGVEMQTPSDRRIWKVTTRVSLIELVFYAAIGLAGYYSFGDGSQQNFVSNYPEGDLLAFMVRSALATAIFFGVPINLSPTAKSAANVVRFLCTGREERELLLTGHLGAPSNSVRYICVLALGGLAGTTAWLYSDVADVVGLLGATLGTFLLAVVPLAVYVRVLKCGKSEDPNATIGSSPKEQLRARKCFPISFIIVAVLSVVSIVNIAGSGVTVYSMIYH